MMPDIRVRIATREDVAGIRSLAEELGYPYSEEIMKGRLENLLSEAEHILLVAERGDGEVVGWVHGFVRKLLIADVQIEIGGLVVQEDFRGMGIGKKLLEEVEDWARKKGIGVISLRSNIIREEAHRFYEEVGYEVMKTSKIFRKRLG